MGVFLAVLVFISLSLSLTTVFRKRIEETLPVSMLIVIILIYIAGLTGHLQAGVYIVAAISVPALALFAVKTWKTKINILQYILTPGLGVFVLLLVFSLFLQHSRVLVGWDEMSHWALAAKNMFLHNEFGTSLDSNLIFKDYPPAAAIFEYFFLLLNGRYSDSIILISFNILALSPLLILFRNLEWSNLKQIVLRLFVIMVLPLAFYCDYRISVIDFYTSIYVDPLLGILFGYVLISWFSDSKDGFRSLKICCALFVMTILKASGFSLALIFVITAILQELVLKRRNIRSSFTRPFQSLMILISVFFAEFSWKAVMAANHISKEFNTDSVNLYSVISTLAGRGKPYTHDVLKNFMIALFTKPLVHAAIVLPIGVAVLTAAVIGLIVFLVRLEPDQEGKLRIKVAGTTLILLGVVYTFGLLILYLFSFSPAEAVSLASYGRYLNTYFLGLMLFLFFLLVNANFNTVVRRRIFGVVLVCLLLITNPLSFAKDFGAALLGNKHSVQTMSPYRDVSIKLDSYASQDGIKTPRLYFIDGSSVSYEYFAAKYYITPDIINSDWSEKDLTVDNLTKQLDSGYDYVYLFSVNESFRNEFGTLFQGGNKSIQEKTLYQVMRQNNKVSLKACN